MGADADIAKIGALVADPARARVLLALGDGRALPATVLADEAGVAASTASAHLSKLVAGGLLTVQRHGRHRYFRVAGPDVAELLEALARLSPTAPVRSLRDGTNASAVRSARTCYDHLGGVLGTGLMAALLEQGLLVGGDGRSSRAESACNRPSAPGFDLDYRVTDRGFEQLAAFGIDFSQLARQRRPLVRYCVDWSEQRHHVSGALGAALANRLLELGWIRRTPGSRAVQVTAAGRRGLRETFGVDLNGLAA
jgi:DNA-binding transcriptional ArsR family regulator